MQVEKKLQPFLTLVAFEAISGAQRILKQKRREKFKKKWREDFFHESILAGKSVWHAWDFLAKMRLDFEDHGWIFLARVTLKDRTLPAEKHISK